MNFVQIKVKRQSVDKRKKNNSRLNMIYKRKKSKWKKQIFCQIENTS